MKAEVIASLKQFILQTAGGAVSKACTVKSYDATTKTCYCEPLDGSADIQQARVLADSSGDGLFLKPKINSVVIVTFLTESSAFISMISEVDEIHLAGVNYGGIGKTSDIATKLSNIENKINALITAISGWVPVANDGGAALKVALTTWLATSLEVTVQADISSTVVKHGDGN